MTWVRNDWQPVIMIQDPFFGFGLTLNTVFKMWGTFLKNAIFEISVKIVFVNKFELFCVFPVSCIKLTMHTKHIW